MTAARVPLPQRLDGLRCLDVSTSDGFWAAEMERRGAAETVAVDVRDPERAVSALHPSADGHFDVVLLGSLLPQLRDPVLGLERVRSVCAGIAVVADAVELGPSLVWRSRPVVRLVARDREWWKPNRAALLRMVQSAGFELEVATGVYFVRDRGSQGRAGRRPSRVGLPHVAVRARPRR